MEPGSHAVTEARETSASRMRRISDADALRRPCAQVLRPLYECIGHCDARRDRQEWRKLLDERFELERRERDVESDLRILCGDIDDRLKSVVLRDEQFIVAFFLSSTFTDTEWERNLLISDVLPYLTELARKYGLELRLAEMRWGIREEASSEHQTSEICMNELERCQRESLGLFYVFLACQKYGFRPFPPKIPQGIFASLRDQMSAEDAALVDKCFELDTNVYVPARATSGVTAAQTACRGRSLCSRAASAFVKTRAPRGGRPLRSCRSPFVRLRSKCGRSGLVICATRARRRF